MKAIINGFRYDTEKAIEIGGYSTGGYDFSDWGATLYITPMAKKYFLAGSGGPMSRFGRRMEDATMGYGEHIIPMNKEDAFAWAQSYLNAEEIEAHFAEMIREA